MTSTRAIRRLIGSAAVATATAGLTIAANAMIAAPAATAAYPLCETLTLSGDFNHTFGQCLNSPLPTACVPQTVGLEPTQDATLNVCVII